MAKGNLPACLRVTLPHEGGYVDHPDDPGGATNMGITHRTLAAWRGVPFVSKQAVKSLSLAEATDIYRERYWNVVSGEALPWGVDLAVFDYGVNAGPPQAARDLQRSVGAPVDGVVGPVTLGWVAAAGDGKRIIKAICSRRLSFKQGLRNWETFKRGWSRRVADVEARGVAMWLAHTTSTEAAKRDLRDEADAAGKAAQRQNQGASGAAAGGTAIGGGDAVVTGEPNWLLIVGVVIVVGLVVAGLVMKARQNKDRAAAYAAVASGS